MFSGSLVKPLVCIGFVLIMLTETNGYPKVDPDNSYLGLLGTVLKRQFEMPPTTLPQGKEISNSKGPKETICAMNPKLEECRKTKKKSMENLDEDILELIFNMRQLENENRPELFYEHAI